MIERIRTYRIRKWLKYSPQPLFILLVGSMFIIYGLMGFEMTVIILLILILRVLCYDRL